MTVNLRPGFQFKTFLHLLRALFPKWSFFDQVAYKFEVEFKVAGSSNWIPITFFQTRQPLGLFLNPQVNMALAQVNIIEHFAHDIQLLQQRNDQIRSKDVHKLTSYKLLHSLLYVKLKEFDLDPRTIQFKIVARSPQETVDVFISDWVTFESA